MQIKGLKYDFNAKPWQYNGSSSWTFISIPEIFAIEIRNNLKSKEEGWGRLKATAKIGNTEWKTAIWFDTKMKTYLFLNAIYVRNVEIKIIGKNIILC
jgi:hypothetical protein